MTQDLARCPECQRPASDRCQISNKFWSRCESDQACWQSGQADAPASAEVSYRNWRP